VAGSLGAVSQRAVLALCVILLVVAGGAFLLTRDRGPKEQAAVQDPLAEALAYAPTAAPAVAQLDVQRGTQQGEALRELARTFPAARFAADGVRSAVLSLGFDADADLPSLLGGPLVVWGPAEAITGLAASASSLQLELGPVLRAGATMAVVGRSVDDVAAVLDRAVEDRRLRKLDNDAIAPGIAQYALPNSVGVLGVRDADLVLASTTARLRDAFALHDRQGGLSRAVFERRLGPLNHSALLRAVAEPRALLSARAQGVPWVDALRGGALAVRIEKPGIRLQVHLATDPARLKATDLPLAPGATPPAPAAGARPIAAGVRGLAQTIRVLDAAKGALDVPFLTSITTALATLDSVKGPLKTFGRIDVDAALIDQLTGTTTITPEAHPNTLALRAELHDGGPLRSALGRIAAVPDFAVKLAGIDLNVEHAGDDAYTITRDGKAFIKVAVIDTTLVVTNDLTANLQAIAKRPARQTTTSATQGALALHADGKAVQDELIRRLGLPQLARLIIGGFGDVDGSARAELDGVDLEVTLTLNQ
jgi:hypothetical protein